VLHTPESQRRKGKSILEVMRNQGVGALQGVGGSSISLRKGTKWSIARPSMPRRRMKKR